MSDAALPPTGAPSGIVHPWRDALFYVGGQSTVGGNRVCTRADDSLRLWHDDAILVAWHEFG
jgi:hypothetical protein